MAVLKDRARRSTDGTFLVRGNLYSRGGTIRLGDAGDVNLYRADASTLRTSDGLTVDLAFTPSSGLTIGAGGTAIVVSAGGTVTWRSDPNLYWGEAGVLKTDKAFQALTVKFGTGGTKIVTTGGGTVIFASDTTNLYWASAGVLKTDGALLVTTNLGTRDAGGTAPLGIMPTAGMLQVGNLGGTPRIFANVGGTVYQFSGISI